MKGHRTSSGQSQKRPKIRNHADEGRLKQPVCRSAECRRTAAVLARTEQELEARTWGLKKTNESIKILYKELERRNLELQKLDQLKSDFISTVSHELRTPLTIIREGVSQVLDGLQGELNAEQKEFLSISLDGIDRLGRIINNLLDISKLEAGKIFLKRSRVNVPSLIYHVMGTFQSSAKRKGLELKTRFSAPDVELYADRDKLIQVFTNLIGNAIKFTERGFVEASVYDQADSVEFSVLDTGRGIAVEDLQKVFDRFQQFSRVAGPGERGTGLGLSISRGIVELHKGEIWVESREGEGSRFSFRIPKLEPRTLFKEYVDKDLRDALEQLVPVSLGCISIKGFDSLRHRFDRDKLFELEVNLETVVNRTLRRRADTAVKDGDAFLLALPATGKKEAQVVMDRILAAIQDFLHQGNAVKEIELDAKMATCPDDGDSKKDLLKLIGLS